MPVYMFIILFCCKAMQTIVKKYSTKRYINGLDQMASATFTQYAVCTVVAIVLALFSGFNLHIDLATVLISAVSGIILGTSSYFGYYCLTYGSIIQVSVFSAASVVLSSACGWVFFENQFNLLYLLGIALYLGAMYFISVPKGTRLFDKKNMHMIFFLILVFLGEGLFAVGQNMITYVVGSDDSVITAFQLLCFAFAAVVMGALLPSIVKRSNVGLSKVENKGNKKLFTLPIIITSAMLGAFVFLVNNIMTKSTSYLPQAIFFPTVSALSMLLSLTIGAVVFKEKITPRVAIGVVLSLLALITMNWFDLYGAIFG